MLMLLVLPLSLDAEVSLIKRQACSVPRTIPLGRIVTRRLVKAIPAVRPIMIEHIVLSQVGVWLASNLRIGGCLRGKGVLHPQPLRLLALALCLPLYLHPPVRSRRLRRLLSLYFLACGQLVIMTCLAPLWLE